MKLAWRWIAPMMLRLLTSSHATLISSAAALSNAGSVHLVFEVRAGLIASPTELLSPAPERPLSTTFLQLTSQELSFPIMPLHLLGKKSWNVYNQDNIDKVRRDEAVAKAKEEAAEERMQEIDAQRRMQVLRGEVPTIFPTEEDRDDDQAQVRRPRAEGGERRKRKRYGEDDTDFEMRVAHERAQAVNQETQIVLRRPSLDVPLTNRDGHIDLFPQEESKASAKNPEAEREMAKKKKEYEDQYTMRFSNAAGFKQRLTDPWYSQKGAKPNEVEAPSKDVWGNEDPRRKERQAARIVSSDPLAMMKQGAAQVRKVEKERKAWLDEREREMAELKRAERKDKKRKRRHREDDELEGFSLDGPEKRSGYGEREHKRRHKGSERHPSRDVSRERDSERGRERHKSRH